MTKLLLGILLFTAIAKPAQVVDLYTPQDIAGLKKQLAKDKTGFASKPLEKYGNHYTMLAYRESTGSSEIHEHEADIFFIAEGDSSILLGGKMVGGHTQKPGEIRGSSIEGGEKRPLKTGDIIHIPAGLPHQILVTPGKPITYFVVKVMGQ
jgi:mannose-6-phosphate isomerase-like protein (cupin superfamily)